MYTNDFVDMRWHTGLCTAVGAGPAAAWLSVPTSLLDVALSFLESLRNSFESAVE